MYRASRTEAGTSYAARVATNMRATRVRLTRLGDQMRKSSQATS
jgi:hypothetical protein